MAEIAFYGFSALSIGAALTILFTRNVMYAALCLFLTLLGVAALFVLSGADFLAITQLLIYVGGVLVLIMFGIMLTYRPDREGNQTKNYVLTGHLNRFWGTAVALGIFGILFWIILNANFMITQSPQLAEYTPQHSTLRIIGVSLMTTHVWAFEVIGILLLAALIGAAYVATQRDK
ncbi:NADH-quinone oxidoreductase subunit J family protein [Runella slithyformis]|uniref:NADH-quinone oxidoreductase subunit J n=1 Tax=Runella slithyformis (strain ATCC 29530 / DSM 19594 / LMG 11500 / NCIMB 11436 / LSU 4) TaxID=761193 RepID=A0A7U3ZR22_RUNSL|nr:NADH-quinone oxidoreductase subunit J [Runella slithyformis]AEI51792.1 NADH-ubiquinone/plastoquinone oxidoreductase chain 6 [Runella slithyformis DSM 19594]